MAWNRKAIAKQKDRTQRMEHWARQRTTRGSCGKHCLESRGEALTRIRYMQTIPGHVERPGETLCAYECRECGAWHVGHTRIEA